MEGLRQALFTDIQDIKQEKKHHIGVILVSVSPIHAFGSKKTEKGSIDMFIFKIKREQAQFTAKKFRTDGTCIHISQSKYLLLQCRRKRIEEHAKRHKKV